MRRQRKRPVIAHWKADTTVDSLISFFPFAFSVVERFQDNITRNLSPSFWHQALSPESEGTGS